MDAIKVGDRVKHADADEPGNIPAYRAMRGEVKRVAAHGAVWVAWLCDGALGQREPSGPYPSHALTVTQ